MKKFASLDSLVDNYHLSRPIDWNTTFGRDGKLYLEIGFGLGELLTRQAQECPQHNFIGIEENWERTYRTLKKITLSEPPLRNARILFIDATVALERLFQEKTIAHVDCLFPCPWPKKAHAKHRLFSSSFLQLLNNRLIDGAKARIVTDYKEYSQWILNEIDATSGFEVNVDEINPRFNTKFERKWASRGQQIFFEITLTKKKHVDHPVSKDIEMKSYKLEEFDPEKFVMNKSHDDVCSVIFKEAMYDSVKKVFLVTVIINEGALLQPFRVVVHYKDGAWRICKAEEQTFFPTPGINKAIEAVYQAALSTLK